MRGCLLGGLVNVCNVSGQTDKWCGVSLLLASEQAMTVWKGACNRHVMPSLFYNKVCDTVLCPIPPQQCRCEDSQC